MAKTIKSFSLDDDVVQYLDGTGNASSEVNTLVRRHMLSRKAQEISGYQPSSAERESARRWARTELAAAQEDIDGGQYDDVRREMGWAA
ncbi:hypothetical protein AB0M47_41880 [Hamadaea sp. NPDC051192]|uniref:hypothetical protein n=1 Tax=Hamadaea sp. NPDC051192 TaxID=3154940 RepID=UPI00344771C6